MKIHQINEHRIAVPADMRVITSFFDAHLPRSLFILLSGEAPLAGESRS